MVYIIITMLSGVNAHAGLHIGTGNTKLDCTKPARGPWWMGYLRKCVVDLSSRLEQATAVHASQQWATNEQVLA